MENACAKKKKGSIWFFENQRYERFSRHPRDVRGIMHWPFVPAILFHPLNPTSDRGWSLSTLFFFFPHRRGVAREVFINQSITRLCLKACWKKKEKRKKERRTVNPFKEKKGKKAAPRERVMKAYSSCVDKIFAHNSPATNEYIMEKILIK